MKSKKVQIDYIPVLTVAAVLPLLVYVHLYNCADHNVALLDSSATYSDFFSFGKSLLFGVLAFGMAWKMFSDRMISLTAKKQKHSFDNIFWLLFALGAWQMVSVFFAIDKKVALFGGYQRFEGTYVLLGYIVLCYYTYKITKQHGKTEWIVTALSISSIVMATAGLLQVFWQDPFMNKYIQMILLPFGGKGEVESTLKIPKAYMTLANPNTASVYLSMVIPFFFMAYFRSKSKQRILVLTALILDGIMLVFTGSRVGIVALGVTGVIGLVQYRKKVICQGKKTGLVLLAIVAIFFVANMSMKLTTMSLMERFEASSVRGTTHTVLQCETEEDGVHIKKGEKEYVLRFLSNDSLYLSLKIYDDKGADVSKTDFSYDTGTFTADEFSNVTISEVQIDEEPFLMVQEEQEWFFTYDENGGYLLYVGQDAYDKIGKVDKVDLNGYESFASGRGYIWSRALPLVKKYGVFGCGADNFVFAFPQDDYNGKRQYCENHRTIIEKPHNAFLQIAIQNGIPAVLLLVVFYILFLKRVWKKGNPFVKGAVLGTISYVIGMCFNDSNVMVTPVFFLFVGLAFGSVEKNIEKGENHAK